MTLATGQYTIGAFVTGGDTARASGSILAIPEVTYGTVVSIGSTSLTRPTITLGLSSLMGPSFKATPAASAVPEPSTVASLGLAGLIGLAARSRRRLRASA